MPSHSTMMGFNTQRPDSKLHQVFMISSGGPLVLKAVQQLILQAVHTSGCLRYCDLTGTSSQPVSGSLTANRTGSEYSVQSEPIVLTVPLFYDFHKFYTSLVFSSY